MNSALEAAFEGWHAYPARRTSNLDSFSQMLFRALTFPEVRGDESSITMHQLLRLIYVDQAVSSTDSLLRDETFDSPLTRRTVGEFLFGVYDDSIYQEEMLLREKGKRLDVDKKQLETVVDVLNEAEQEIDLIKVQGEISDSEEQLNRIRIALSNDSIDEGLNVDIDPLKTLETTRKNLIQNKRYESELSDELERQQFEVDDSKLFVESLEKRLRSLDDSLETKQSLGMLPLTHCPSCLAELHDSVNA